MCKLALEGQLNLLIAIKGQVSERLTKRVPIIITTNKAISTYCWADTGTLNVRCYKFLCPNAIPLDSICKPDYHVYNDIGAYDYKDQLPADTPLLQDLCSEEKFSKRIVQECTKKKTIGIVVIFFVICYL